MGAWVDFRELKETVTFDQVLTHYGLSLKARGKELSGRCPFHKDPKPSFRINLDKKVFHCFGCQAKGNLLDFVAAMEQCSVRDAALRLQDWFGIQTSNTPGSGDEKGESGKDFDLNRTEIRRQLESPPSTVVAPNSTLPFTLKGIDPGHPYLVERGVRRDLAEFFGLGFFPGKGSMRNRIVIPIHNPQGQLVAYAGRAIDDTEPRYKLPQGFHKGHELFNLHRVRADQNCRRVIIVEGFFDCIRVVEAGFSNTVALMGSSLSEYQEQLLEPFAEIVLMLDGDEAGRKAAAEILTRLSSRHFVRLVEVPDQPDTYPIAQLQTLLTF